MTTLAGDDAVIRRAERGLQRVALALCLLVGVAVWAFGWTSAQSARERQSLQRAAALAQSLATRISAALSLGVPFDRLRGVEAAFDRALRETDGAQRIALMDASESLVRQAGTPADSARGSATTSARAAIVYTDAQGEDRVAGTVVVDTRRADATRLAWEMSVLLLAVASIGALTLFELWRWQLRRGPGLRVEVMQRARQLTASGDWTTVPDAEPSARHAWIRAYGVRVRALTQRYRRIRRLTASLASTEPVHAERSRLEGLHEQARGLDQFPPKVPDHVRVSSAWHDLRITCFLMLAASEGMRLGTGQVTPDTAAWLVVLYAMGGLAGQTLADKLGRSALASIVLALVCIAAGWLVVALSDAGAAVWIGRALSSVGAGLVLGVAAAFCAAHAAHADHAVHESGTRDHRPHGVEQAIAFAGEWVGPLLGLVLIAVLGSAAAWLLLALALASGWAICSAIARQAPWPLHWPRGAQRRPGSSDAHWSALATAARGALLAWLVGRTASGLAHDSIEPVALWLAYAAGACASTVRAGAALRRPGVARGLRVLAAVVALAAATALFTAPFTALAIVPMSSAHWPASAWLVLNVLVAAASVGLILRGTQADSQRDGRALPARHWLPLASGAAVAALLEHCTHAA